jgi:hypothetical protein
MKLQIHLTNITTQFGPHSEHAVSVTNTNRLTLMREP